MEQFRRTKSHKTIRLLVAIVAVALAASTLHPSVAFGAQGSLTIEHEGNASVSYDAYCLFVADISEEGTATHVRWASDEAREAILPFLDARGLESWLQDAHPDLGGADSAQIAAEFVAAKMEPPKKRSEETRASDTTQGSAFGRALARHVVSSEAFDPLRAESGISFVAEQGLWLFVSHEDAIAQTGGAGTAPLWVALGGPVEHIVEKASTPTVDKLVRDDASSTWGKVADAARNQPISFLMRGTLPDTYGTFSRYHYCLCDRHSEGLDLVVPEGVALADALDIRIDGEQVRPDGENLAVGYEQGVLTVDFRDLKASHWEALGIKSESVVTVEYRALLNDKASMGATGNPNEARLRYTCDPVSERDSETPPSQAKLFTYGLAILKQDASGTKALPGAAFAVQVAEDNADKASRGLFVQADGSLAKSPCQHITDAEGTVLLEGLDKGSYVLRETAPPKGYRSVGTEMHLTIEATLAEEEQTLSSLASSVSSESAKVSEVSPERGVVTVSVRNEPEGARPPYERLAQTGVGPISLVLVGAGLLALATARRGG